MPTRNLSTILRSIPDSRTSGETIEQLTQRFPDEKQCGLTGYIQGIVDVLNLLGAVSIVKDDVNARVRAKSEVALYLLRCLAAFADSGFPAFAHWDTEGVDQTLVTHDKIHRVVNLIYALERRRQQVTDDPVPLRHQQVAQVVIKRDLPDDPLGAYLLQYDRNAGSYQFIGGRFRNSDGDLQSTLIRELSEELKLQLRYGQDFDLSLMAENVTFKRYSMTFGILTSYTVNYYHLRNFRQDIPPSPDNRWVSFRELVRGQASDDRPISSDVILKQPVDWQTLPSSFRSS